jgi:uncharacterized protein (DUF58 family)
LQLLFEPEFLNRLDHLRLVLRRRTTGRQAGERRSTRRGHSVEFADFRSYAHGDDFRRIDWNAYARLERLFLKLFVEEQETHLSLVVDASASMDWGEPNKLRMATRIAGALGYLALTGFDRVTLSVVSDRLRAFHGPFQGRHAVYRLWEVLSRLQGQGVTDLNRACRSLPPQGLRSGIAVVFSDLLAPLEQLSGLIYLRAAGQEVTLVQVLSPDEIDPFLEGDLRLIDTETEAAEEVSEVEGLSADYRERLSDHTEAIRRFCMDRGVNFLQVPSTLSVEDVILRSLRTAGLVG